MINSKSINQKDLIRNRLIKISNNQKVINSSKSYVIGKLVNQSQVKSN